METYIALALRGPTDVLAVTVNMAAMGTSAFLNVCPCTQQDR